MKNIIALMMLFICGCCFSSCDFTHTTDNYPIDSTLAGSINYGHYTVGAEGSYDGVELGFASQVAIEVSKVSDNEISLTCRAGWSTLVTEPVENAKIIEVSIPKIPLSGRPFDVTFDCMSDEVKVLYDGFEYVSSKTSTKGWIKEVKQFATQTSHIGSGTPAILLYKCDISIDCVVDGKAVSLKITSKEEPQ